MPSYVAIAHVVDREILKQVSVHIIKLCGWAYNAVTIRAMQASNFKYITIAI